IGIDPYYFIYEAEKLGYHSQIILSGRKINDGMGAFVADAAIKNLIRTNKVVKKAKVVILGLTFKENCPDTRNSKVEDIINRLKEYEIEPLIVDPYADTQVAKKEYDVDIVPFDSIKEADCLIFAVSHDIFKSLEIQQIDNLFRELPNEEKVIIDVKSILDKKLITSRGYSYWNL